MLWCLGWEKRGHKRDMDIQDQVLLKTVTSRTKTILKYCSKTSNVGTKLKAKTFGVVPHMKMVTRSLFTWRPPSRLGQGFNLLWLCSTLCPTSPWASFPLGSRSAPHYFPAPVLMLQATHSHFQSLATLFHWRWQCLNTAFTATIHCGHLPAANNSAQTQTFCF